jgi:hypothetical protein
MTVGHYVNSAAPNRRMQAIFEVQNPVQRGSRVREKRRVVAWSVVATLSVKSFKGRGSTGKSTL